MERGLPNEKKAYHQTSSCRTGFSSAFWHFCSFSSAHAAFFSTHLSADCKNTNAENTLGTAVSYLTTKFRQHDTVNGIFTGKLDNLSALCFRDTLNDQDYITYIYLDQGNLKELFTSDSSSANASAGTTIAQLSDFQISESRPGFYSFELKDSEGNKETFYLHQNSVSKEAS